MSLFLWIEDHWGTSQQAKSQQQTYRSNLVWQFSPFFSGYLVVPGAGIEDDEDVKEQPEGGATGCAEHVEAAG